MGAPSSSMTSGDIGWLVSQIPTHYPFVLVDRILERARTGAALRVDGGIVDTIA